MNTLILGGARSGKSRFAERLAAPHHGERLYIATAENRDGEMDERIRYHREQRGQGWHTIEEPIEVAALVIAPPVNARFILIDCLTLWLSNLMEHRMDIGAYTDALCRAIVSSPVQVVLVANEVGLGLVPEYKLGRQFRDHAGIMHQQVAAACERVVFMVAGLPMVLKGEGA